MGRVTDYKSTFQVPIPLPTTSPFTNCT